MIKAAFKKSKDKILAFDITGHADFDDYDRDIVCSGVSAVSQTIVIGITEVLKAHAFVSAEEGNLSLNLYKSSKEDIDKCQTLLETMKLGLISMEKGYGDYINVIEEEV
ncbi:MAG: ribosomal-processing cysteine protease Prp [Clostridiaceae bacterium]